VDPGDLTRVNESPHPATLDRGLDHERTRNTAEQIIRKLKTAEQLIAQGKTVALVVARSQPPIRCYGTQRVVSSTSG
jgi:hypothetical protein